MNQFEIKIIVNLFLSAIRKSISLNQRQSMSVGVWEKKNTCVENIFRITIQHLYSYTKNRIDSRLEAAVSDTY